MVRYSGNVTDLNSVPLPGALVLVQSQATGALADLRNAGGGVIANPIVVDALGGYEFYVTDGIYDFYFSYGGRLIRESFNNIIGLPAQSALIAAAIVALTSGQYAWSLPDEANGGTVPATGSGKPYLSAGVMKIA